MGLFKNYVSQTRKPEGFLGKMMLGGMNSGYAKLADWGFTHLPEMLPESAVDLGCGGGRNAGELLKMYPKAHVTAVDYSELSVEKAKDYNKAMIAAGRCEVLQGDVSDFQLPKETFDLATAFETIYFWPGLEKCFSQVTKVLKPGGYFMIHAALIREGICVTSDCCDYCIVGDKSPMAAENELKRADNGLLLSVRKESR